MKWSVRFKNDALDELSGVPKGIRVRIAARIALLEENPFPGGFKKLRNFPHLYRLRVGDYRVLYDVDESDRIIRILRVRHRRDAYRGL